MNQVRRRPSRLLIEPFQQLRFGFHVISTTLIFCIVIFALLFWSFTKQQGQYEEALNIQYEHYAKAFKEQYAQVEEIFNVAEGSELFSNEVFIKNTADINELVRKNIEDSQDAMNNNIILSGVLLIIMALILAFVVTKRTHRMYGPMIAMSRALQELQKGNYTHRIKIREKDDFKKVVAELNNLAEVLEKKNVSHKY